MFTKILIANRGEIACRVAATCRKLGIRTVAVYSDADADSRHVANCDEAIHIGGAAPKDSYLRAERIIAAATQTGAQAIHPGYGFLSENEEFAEACAQAGITFIGPPPSAIRAMGLKAESKRLMEAARVPLVPGYHGADQNPALLQSEAGRIGYPVLLKASAGGGGKGMRVVERSEDFLDALASCKREAINSFGDDAVLIEKYLTRPRHIEIQVFADTLGNFVYLLERDCSVQRRHQKVLEEAPAPGMSTERRQAMGDAAVAAARAVGYVGAGTVEFIANQDGSFYFMEMNTRLQVEHPVTEMITGQDLVEWQLRVASGEPLPLLQHQLQIHGHALEARVYAENPDNNFLPSTGTLHVLHTPAAVNFDLGTNDSGDPAGVRIDSGVREGDTISPFYDPMIAKLIVWGRDRKEALARMHQALGQFQVVGLSTNLGFLSRLVQSHAFASADLDTGLIERNRNELFPEQKLPSMDALALAIAALLKNETTTLRALRQRGDPHSPWAQTDGWHLNVDYLRILDFTHLIAGQEQPIKAELRYTQGAIAVEIQGQHLDFSYHAEGPRIQLTIRCNDEAGKSRRSVVGDVHQHGNVFHVFADGTCTQLVWHDPLEVTTLDEGSGGKLTAPMPGKIVAVHVAKGQHVTKGIPLLVMEAMKMEHTITAPTDGVIAEIFYTPGEQVSEGAQLLELSLTQGSAGAN